MIFNKTHSTVNVKGNLVDLYINNNENICVKHSNGVNEYYGTTHSFLTYSVDETKFGYLEYPHNGLTEDDLYKVVVLNDGYVDLPNITTFTASINLAIITFSDYSLPNPTPSITLTINDFPPDYVFIEFDSKRIEFNEFTYSTIEDVVDEVVSFFNAEGIDVYKVNENILTIESNLIKFPLNNNRDTNIDTIFSCNNLFIDYELNGKSPIIDIFNLFLNLDIDNYSINEDDLYNKINQSEGITVDFIDYYSTTIPDTESKLKDVIIDILSSYDLDDLNFNDMTLILYDMDTTLRENTDIGYCEFSSNEVFTTSFSEYNPIIGSLNKINGATAHVTPLGYYLCKNPIEYDNFSINNINYMLDVENQGYIININDYINYVFSNVEYPNIILDFINSPIIRILENNKDAEEPILGNIVKDSLLSIISITS